MQFAQSKNGSKSELFSGPVDAQESANRTMINAFEVCLMTQFRVHLIIHMQLHLEVQFKIFIKMYKKVHLRLQ